MTDSSWLKIIRASKHLKTLEDGITADADRTLDEVLTHSKGDPTLHLPEPNETIAILADEVIYHLRSALDHLAFDLVKLNRDGITLPVKWEENCMFPLWAEIRSGQKPPLPYNTFTNLPGIPKEAHAIIEGVQPYYGAGVRAVNNFTGFLAALSNVNKHRRFALTRTRAFYAVNMLHESGRSTSSAISLEHSAEVPPDFIPDEPDRIVNVDRSISLFIAFDERKILGDATDVRIEEFLKMLLTSIVVDIYNPLKAIISG